MLISAFVFAIRVVQSLHSLNPKFQTPIGLLLLYSPVCVGSGRKPRRQIFSQRGSYNFDIHSCFDLDLKKIMSDVNTPMRLSLMGVLLNILTLISINEYPRSTFFIEKFMT